MYITRDGNSNWYMKYPFYGMPNEKRCPIPGRCMNPMLAGEPRIAMGSPDGLGYDFTIGTPIGDQSFSIPIEQMVHDVTQMAVNAALPILEQEFPKLLQMAQDQIVNKLWPTMKPQLEAEVNKYYAQIKPTAQKDVILAVVGISVAILGGFALLKRSKKSTTLSSK